MLRLRFKVVVDFNIGHEDTYIHGVAMISLDGIIGALRGAGDGNVAAHKDW